jgi:hypothetical protein
LRSASSPGHNPSRSISFNFKRYSLNCSSRSRASKGNQSMCCTNHKVSATPHEQTSRPTSIADSAEGILRYRQYGFCLLAWSQLQIVEYYSDILHILRPSPIIPDNPSTLFLQL